MMTIKISKKLVVICFLISCDVFMNIFYAESLLIYPIDHRHIEDGFVVSRNEDHYEKEILPCNSLPTPDMIRSYDYECEIHKYETADGYVNTLHRIPPNTDEGFSNQQLNNSKIPLFLQHGLLGTSADWVMGIPSKSLGYILSDLGYDVWLGNARGNAYSREHKTLTIDDSAYWKFSFDEMGKFDVPAAVDYILNITSSTKLTYVGHSMGTTMFMIAESEWGKNFSQKINGMVAMAPIAKVTHMISGIKYLAKFAYRLEELFEWLGFDEFRPSGAISNILADILCDCDMRRLRLCANFLFILAGFDAAQMNMTMLPIILGHEPGGTSSRTIVHFAQEYNADKFQKYDHGYLNNLRIYGTPNPPSYHPENVTSRMLILKARNDWLADLQDVEWLTGRLPNVEDIIEMSNPKFNHIDFLWGIDSDKPGGPFQLTAAFIKKMWLP